MDRILLSTTDSIKGCEITEQKGIIITRAIAGPRFFSQMPDSGDLRSQRFECGLSALYEEALADFEKLLDKECCNAAIGIRCDFNRVYSMDALYLLMLSITGTAVNVTRLVEKEPPLMSLARGKDAERALKDQDILKVCGTIDDLLKGPKIVNLETIVRAIATKPTQKERIDEAQLTKVIQYLNANYLPDKLTRVFIETLQAFKNEKSQAFELIYEKCVLPYFEYMKEALDKLDKKDVDKYIRTLESKSRKDYTLDDVQHIDEYIGKLTELGYNLEKDPKDEMFSRIYGITPNKGIAFVTDLKDAIRQFYGEKG